MAKKKKRTSKKKAATSAEVLKVGQALVDDMRKSEQRAKKESPSPTYSQLAQHMRRLERLDKGIRHASQELVEAQKSKKEAETAKAQVVIAMLDATTADGQSVEERSKAVAGFRVHIRKAEGAVARLRLTVKETRDKRDGKLRQFFEEVDEPTGFLMDVE